MDIVFFDCDDGIGCNNYVTPERVGAIIAGLMARGGNFIRNGSGALMLDLSAYPEMISALHRAWCW